MATFADLLGHLQEQRFVGRSRELRLFKEWLADPAGPPILAVSGPVGVGKSWILDRYAREAGKRRVFWVYCAALDRSPGALWRAICGTPDPGEAAAALRGDDALLLVDSVDSPGVAPADLHELLLCLDSSVRVVAAGRRALEGGPWRRWEALIRRIELGALSLNEANELLDRRGVTSPELRTKILTLAGGHPLSLSLATDLVVDLGAESFESHASWRSGIADAVAPMIEQVGGEFAEALQAAAVLHTFDRESLAALLGSSRAEAALPRLAALSSVRAAHSGLALHDEVRKLIVENMRLHDPVRLDSMRRQAMRHHRRAAARASPEEREGLAMRQLSLFARDAEWLSGLFAEDSRVTVSRARPEDLEDLRAEAAAFTPWQGMAAVDFDPGILGRLLESSEATVLLARDRQLGVCGYRFYVNLSEAGSALLSADRPMASLIRAVARTLGAEGGWMPNAYYLSNTISAAPNPEAHARLRAATALLLARAGAYIVVPGEQPHLRELLESLHFEPVEEPGSTELRGYLLDLSRSGFEGWVEGLVAGRRPQRLPPGEDLVKLVARLVEAFEDDERLAASAVALLAEPDEAASLGERAEAARQLLTRSLTALGPWPSLELRLREALESAGVSALPRSAGAERARSPTGTPLTPSFPPAGTAIGIRLLGDFAVIREGRVAELSGVAASAVKAVALRGRLHAEELIELLWPEVEPSTGRTRLRNVLAKVRRAVGEVLARHGPEVALADGVLTDVAEFERLVRLALAASGPERHALRLRAVEAYSGELLPADRYASWGALERERLKRLYLGVLDDLAAEAEAAGDFGEAVRWLELGAEVDPYDDERYLKAAELLAASGRRGRALALLTRARAAAASVALPPSPALEALEERLRAGAGPLPPSG